MCRNRILLAAFTATLSASLAYAQPANDDCAHRQSVGVGSTAFDSTLATSDGSFDCAFGGSEIYFEFNPAVTGLYSIDLCGSSFDTVLSALAGCGGAEIACNDDSCGLQSSVGALTVTAGTPIVLRVASYGGGAGAPGVLNITAVAPADWEEAINGGGDAGQTRGTAQIVSGSGALHSIGGALDPNSDADVYVIQVCDHANFSASTLNSLTGVTDTQLFLFRYPSGTGVTSDDDSPGGGTLHSIITGVNVSSNGLYYLAISQYDNDPVDAGGLELWNDTPYTAERVPDGPGAGNPWADFDGGGRYTGGYRVDLTGVCRVTLGCPLAGCDSGGIDVDLNNDCEIGLNDLTLLLSHFGLVGPGIVGDVNNDNRVDINDLTALLGRFGNVCH